ncbi:MAG TPA: T9SS type A sorting domain-containing protein, partial [Bacteroidia bacterium]|nr:T9SS type A sorting domain-containing protein [Bacteroidia bacterium]
TNVVNIQLNLQMDAPFNKYQLYNNLGQLIREEELSFKNHIATITFEDLANGVYFISISNLQNETITKKLVIAK